MTAADRDNTPLFVTPGSDPGSKSLAFREATVDWIPDQVRDDIQGVPDDSPLFVTPGSDPGSSSSALREATDHKIPSYKSSQSGLLFSIKASFHSRRQRLRRFS